MPKLSIIILSYNVRDLLLDCVASIYANQPDGSDWEVIVVDNASSDDSVKAIQAKFSKVKLIISEKNLGFSAGNNLGVKQATGEYLLFLNPDTLIKGKAISSTLDYINLHDEVGAITCKVELPDGRLDYSCHRGLPTPWNAFSYFSGLAKLFPNIKLFSGYTGSYQNLNSIHEIDCATGAFLMVRRQSGTEINWWDEDYFWNGEDIEFCYQLRQKNWKIIYFPSEKIIHFKGSSSGLWSTSKSNVSSKTKMDAAKSAALAMRIFYQKHYKNGVFGWLVWMGIVLLEQMRLFKIRTGLKYA